MLSNSPKSGKDANHATASFFLFDDWALHSGYKVCPSEDPATNARSPELTMTLLQMTACHPDRTRDVRHSVSTRSFFEQAVANDVGASKE